MEQRLEKRIERTAWFIRYPRGLPFALFALGMIITLLSIFNIEMNDAESRRLELDRDTTALASELRRKANENIAYLNAAASVLSVSGEIDDREFTQFVSAMSAENETKGTLGMGWAEWARADQLPRLDARLRASYPRDEPAVRPRPADIKQMMAVIVLIEPQTLGNKRALGFDMASESVRRAALLKASGTGRPTVTSRVHLIQDADNPNSSGVLIYVPVFGRDARGRLLRDRLRGFVYAPIRVQEFLESVEMRLYDGTATIALYDGPPTPENLMAKTDRPFDERARIERNVMFGDRTWTLVATSNARPGLTLVSFSVLVAGTLVSLLLMAIANLIIGRASEDREVLESLARQEAIRNSLTRELNHRVKNTLANVLSIVALTRRRSQSLDDFAESLNGRLRALSATHDLLSQRDWKDAPVREVVIAELAPYLDIADSHVEVAGPDTALGPNDAMSLGLALHELATNAAKYGALSTPQGRVSITWRLLSPELCELSWREEGGPPVTTPSRRGFGLDLIEKIVSHELRSPVDLSFGEKGVTCVLKVPVRTLSEFSLRGGGQA
ncbi:two-component sensor histidine kinase [Novosphingobium kunmingense]|uniref:histidine kinase n=1 Tax=Novosphingobium kunmingense TaxID=1211806 RepID=A0A2N0HK96_9SPHN|nr:CHASE domain-containing protein [Novosphingobium kunmingense]PKB19371.1 two-component sensor histidine kinase [Novosphingobium kunmingense]